MLSAIATTNSPAAMGPYSQAVQTDQLVFVSGQVGLDPATGKVVSDDVAHQTQQVLTNLAAVLEEAGLGLADVAKTTVYLTDMADFATFNQVYGQHFVGPVLPARATVQVAGLAMGLKVEIEAIAVRGRSDSA